MEPISYIVFFGNLIFLTSLAIMKLYFALQAISLLTKLAGEVLCIVVKHEDIFAVWRGTPTHIIQVLVYEGIECIIKEFFDIFFSQDLFQILEHGFLVAIFTGTFDGKFFFLDEAE